MSDKTPPRLGLDTASAHPTAAAIPVDSILEITMLIRPGNTGIEGLCKKTSKGDAEGLATVYIVQSGPYAGQKFNGFLLLSGTTAGHGEAAWYNRAFLRAIFEAIHGIDPNDYARSTVARRADATLAGLHGATFRAKIGIERGGRRPNGGTFKDKNIIAKVFRVGDPEYQKLEQPVPSPMNVAAAAPTATTSVAQPGWTLE